MKPPTRHTARPIAVWMAVPLLFVHSLYGQVSTEEKPEETVEQSSEATTGPKKTPLSTDPPASSTSTALEVTGPDDLGPFERLMADVVNAGLDLALRMDAAAEIVGLAIRDPEAADLLGHVFTDAMIDTESVRILARAVARRSVAPDALAEPLAQLAEQLSGPALFDVLAALGSIRTQSACAALLAYIAPDQPPARRASAFEALERLCAMRSLGTDHDAWRAWFGDASALTPAQWNRLLLENLAHERDHLVRTHAADVARLIEIATQLNLATPSEKRSALLANYLLDPRDELRRLGFDLVERELRQSSQLNGEVAQATITLLSHTDPATRSRAARVIDQIAPPEAGPSVATALTDERDPTVAAQLLKASIRWPSKDLEKPVILWLIAGDETFGPAARAARALRASGLLQDAYSIELAVAALRGRPIGSLTEAALALLADIGQETDRDDIAVLLDSPSPQAARAAALALADRPEYLDHILLAARGQEHLLTIAADAVLSLRPTADGYADIARLFDAPEGETRDTTWLERIAQSLSVEDLFAAAMTETDLDLRERLLVRLADDGLTITEPSREAFARALAELARLQTTHGEPESALLTLDKVPSPSGVDPAHLAALRATALVALGRLDDARQLDAPAGAWLDALESMLAFAPDPNLATAIVTELSASFADSLTEAESARLAALTEAVDIIVQAVGPPDATDPPASATQPPPSGSGGG